MQRKTLPYGTKETISPYDAEDPEAAVILGRIMLSWLQKRMLRDEMMCYLTDEQQLIMDKFVDKKLSHFPEGWDAFIRPDLVYDFVFGMPCPE